MLDMLLSSGWSSAAGPLAGAGKPWPGAAPSLGDVVLLALARHVGVRRRSQRGVSGTSPWTVSAHIVSGFGRDEQAIDLSDKLHEPGPDRRRDPVREFIGHGQLLAVHEVVDSLP